ncbi:hypothetical protein EZS27_005757 [termite gut metagenome]|uniref:Uncharacterized protein n=1 Tax=termite gut metagenome TaxID=433724 RepID=A0A5J4SKW9_9ZZZZ
MYNFINKKNINSVKIMLKKSLNIAIVCGSWIFFLLFSCVDQSYDLNKDIDLTLTVGGESLIFPLGDTEKMFLSKFVKVEDSDLLYEEKEEGEHKGEYKLFKEDEISSTEVTIKDVTIEVKNTELNAFAFSLGSVGGVGGTPIDQTVDIGKLDTSGELTLEKDGMPEEIKSIYSFTPGQINSKFPRLFLTFKITDQDDNPLSGISGIILKDFKLTFPECLVLIDEKGKGIVDGNVYTITETSFAPNTEVFSLDLQLISFENTADGKLDLSTGSFKLDYTVALESNVVVKLSSVPEGGREIKLTPVVSISDIPIASVSGKVDPNIDIKPTTVELEGLPDFLQDDDVKLDLTNPQISLNVSNPLGIPILINATMQGLKNGVSTHEKEIKTGNIEIPAEQTTTIILSKLGGIGDSENHIEYKTIDNLNEIFLIIPEQIKLDITAEVKGEKHTIDLGKTYPIEMNYKIDMPLSFGKDLIIIYNETIDGWNDKMKDLDMKNIYLATNVENTIPLEFHLSGYAIDVNGNKLDGIVIGVVGNQPIAPGKAKTAGLSSPIIGIVAQNSGIMKKMDGVVLKFKANSTKTVNGIPLKSSQYLLMKNIKAMVPGGINVDLN